MTLLVASLVLASGPPLNLPIERLEQVSCRPVAKSKMVSAVDDPDPEVVEVAECGRLKLPNGLERDLTRLHASFPAGEKTELSLNVSARCSIALSSAYSSEAGSSTPTTRLNADFTVETTSVGNYPVMDIEGLDEIVTTKTAHSVLRVADPKRSVLREPDCKLETISTAWADLSGVFTDEKSREMLLIAGKRVFYRANADKKAEELKVVRLDAKSAAVQFGKSPKIYELKLEADALSCKNPDGTLQTFKRTF
jgi:hypothetical protein